MMGKLYIVNINYIILMYTRAIHKIEYMKNLIEQCFIKGTDFFNKYAFTGSF